MFGLLRGAVLFLALAGVCAENLALWYTDGGWTMGETQRDLRAEAKRLRRRAVAWRRRSEHMFRDFAELQAEGSIIRRRAKELADVVSDDDSKTNANIAASAARFPFAFGGAPTAVTVQTAPAAGPELAVEMPNNHQLVTTLLTLAMELTLTWLLRRFMGKIFSAADSQDPAWESLLERREPGVPSSREQGLVARGVIGCDEAKDDLCDAVSAAKSASEKALLGGKPPRGVLLYGPPGTGKTLLARTVAAEARLPLLCLSGSDFNRVFAGQGTQLVKSVFRIAQQKAKRHGGAIIFIDEIDAVGRKRSSATDSGFLRDSDATLNQLLVELDGLRKDDGDGVIVVAATNRAKLLDEALLRPGRLDRKILIPPPDRNGRAQLFEYYLDQLTLESAERTDLQKLSRSLAGLTPGMVGADVMSVANEAALLASLRNCSAVSEAHLLESVDKVSFGAARRRLLSRETKWRVAVHEAGHVLLSFSLGSSDPVEKVSILPRGDFLGATHIVPGARWDGGEQDADEVNATEQTILARMRVALGGRAAESVVLGERATGAEDDLRRVAAMARDMVFRSGLSRLGPVVVGEDEGDSELRRRAQREVDRLVLEAESDTDRLLQARRKELVELATALFERETLSREEITAIVGTPPKVKPLQGMPA